MVTFIVAGNRDETLFSSSYHGVTSTVIKEMKCGSPQHGYRYYCRCEAEDSDLENIVLWYEESLNRLCNLPSGCVTVIENHDCKWDISYYFDDEYDEYGRRIP